MFTPGNMVLLIGVVFLVIHAIRQPFPLWPSVLCLYVWAFLVGRV
jgi:hypothetical protein